MLSDREMQWLVQQIVGTAELLGQEIKPAAAAMLAEDLAAYPADLLAKAFSRVRTEHTGKLTPKVILDRIDEAMGRPSANEAWAMALNALDERKTVVWTSEMSDAWAVAHELATKKDIVGARMAFIATYERLVRTARDERRLPVVTISEGWDRELRGQAVEKAVQLGYLSAQAAAAYVPALEAPAIKPVALLAGNVVTAIDAPPEVRARLAQLREDFATAPERRFQERAKAVQEVAEELKRRKAETQRKVDEVIAKARGAES